MKTILPIAAAALLAGGSLALAQSQTTTTPLKSAPAETTAPAAEGEAMTKVDTATFIKTVPGANGFEIESSKLAEQKATADDVKAFAAEMIKDHTKAGEDFKAALQQVETTSSVKQEGQGLPPKEQKMLDELKAASGDEFQAKYIKMQTDAHKEAVALFSAYADSGDDPALKEFAKKTLPVLQMHEKHVKELGAAHKS